LPIFTRTVRVPVPADELFAWHERAGAFERLSPPGVRVLRGDGRITDGARVLLRVPLAGPLHARWALEHRDYVHGRRFRDVQLHGPFARWVHTHEVSPDGAGASTLTDTIDYALPLGALGRAASRIFVDGQLDRLFRHRHAVTVSDLARHQQFASAGPLRVAITGATGLIGTALDAFLTTGGHTVRRVTRTPTRADDIPWDPTSGTLDPHALEGLDAVVHLAGESLSERWNKERKARVLRSRVEGTGLLARTIAMLERPPRVLLSSSAVGWYGSRGDDVVDERSAPGTGFLAGVTQQWEAATAAAERAGVRVVHARTGVVMSPRGGALPRLLPPFRLGLGGRVGHGDQWMSWIALDDVVGAMHFILHTERLRGAVNVTSPEPVTNAGFAQALGHALHRPAVAVIPETAVRLVLGSEQAEEMVFASQRVVPRALLEAGFAFRHPSIEEALRFELGLD
jgi:uncharacterized protein